MSKPAKIPFQRILSALVVEDQPLNPQYLYRLSDLERSNLEKIKKIWRKIPGWRRLAIMEDVERLSSKDTLLDFTALSQLALQDEEAKVRLLAVRTLGDYDDYSLIKVFLHILRTDLDADVRAAAAGALGRFVYAGELDRISTENRLIIEDTLLGVVNSEDAECIRRAALEAIGYSGRDDVTAGIETAYASSDPKWKASALVAMGRSANFDWQSKILSMLDHKLPLLRRQAARAAGELELSEAVPQLIELLDDPDDDTRLASIWSLSQIGGEGVREILEKMWDAADNDRDFDFLESALDNLTFTEEVQLIPLFDFPETDVDNLDEFDLYDELEPFEDDEDLDD